MGPLGLLWGVRRVNPPPQEHPSALLGSPLSIYYSKLGSYGFSSTLEVMAGEIKN